MEKINGNSLDNGADKAIIDKETINDSDDESLVEQAKAEIAQETSKTADGKGGADGEEDDMNKDSSEYDRLNREKRLAMNRISARERRKRKRELVDDLEKSVVELTKKNEALRETNDKLRTDIDKLTADLIGSTAAGGNNAAAGAAAAAAAALPTAAVAPGATAAQTQVQALLGSTIPSGANPFGAPPSAQTTASAFASQLAAVQPVQSANVAAMPPTSAGRQQLLLQQLQLQQRQRAQLSSLSSLGFGMATDPYASLIENQMLAGGDSTAAAQEAMTSRYLQQLQKKDQNP